jgi:HNH endonuclease
MWASRQSDVRCTFVPDGREAIPRGLKRDVLVEAGHRCAIPRCRSIPVEIAHIEPYKKVKDHRFDNLIALCPTCHTRFDAGQIDVPSMRRYKANLSTLNGRYGDSERRILQTFADNPAQGLVRLPGGMEPFVLYLVRDGLLVKTELNAAVEITGVQAWEAYAITEKGREFIKRWFDAELLE